MSDISTQDVDDFLAHYGVLGMHWGVRHERRRTESFLQRHKKVIVAAGVGSAAVGAGAVALYLKRKGYIRLGSSIRTNHKLKVRSLEELYRAGKINSRQLKTFTDSEKLGYVRRLRTMKSQIF
jgi:hypothetical protein